MTSIDGLALNLHQTAKSKGFWDDDVEIHFVLAKLALVHSEVSETLEAIRKDQGSEKILEEMADIIIRLLDLYAGMRASGWLQGSLEDAILNKAMVNMERPKLHGNLA
jgi:NTP pyrophosphatase (non-canonical NTP hydrolase)